VVKDVWIVPKSAGWKVIGLPRIRLFFNSILKIGRDVRQSDIPDKEEQLTSVR
jgi:hypothetical protein